MSPTNSARGHEPAAISLATGAMCRIPASGASPGPISPAHAAIRCLREGPTPAVSKLVVLAAGSTLSSSSSSKGLNSASISSATPRVATTVLSPSLAAWIALYSAVPPTRRRPPGRMSTVTCPRTA